MGATASLISEETKKLPESAFLNYQKHIQKAVLEEIATCGLQGAELDARVMAFITDNEKKLRADALQAASVSPIDDKKFSSKLKSNLEAMRASHSYKFMVGIDGSATSALSLAVSLKLRHRHDTIQAIHSYYKDNQDTLPPDAKMSNVLEKAETKLRGAMPSERYYNLISAEREEGEVAKDHIVRFLRSLEFGGQRAADFWVCGYTGNRNRHSAENKGNPSIMGSTSDITLRNIHMPVIIVKRDIAEIAKGRTFVVAVGSTEHSKQALEIILSLTLPRDKVIVVHVVHPHNDGAHDSDATLSALERDYSHELDTIAPKGSYYKTLQMSEGDNVDETILRFVNESEDIECDFLAIAPRTNETNNFQYSSLAQQLVLNAKTNVIIVKH
jgi:nucleotide-binding universal stress UspA family protein